MAPLTIEAEITPGLSPEEVTQHATLVEDAGFDRIHDLLAGEEEHGSCSVEH